MPTGRLNKDPYLENNYHMYIIHKLKQSMIAMFLPLNETQQFLSRYYHYLVYPIVSLPSEFSVLLVLIATCWASFFLFVTMLGRTCRRSIPPSICFTLSFQCPNYFRKDISISAFWMKSLVYFILSKAQATEFKPQTVPDLYRLIQLFNLCF